MPRRKIVAFAIAGLFAVSLTLMWAVPGAPPFYSHKTYRRALVIGDPEPHSVTLYWFPLFTPSQGDGPNVAHLDLTGDVRLKIDREGEWIWLRASSARVTTRFHYVGGRTVMDGIPNLDNPLSPLKLAVYRPNGRFRT